MLSLHTRIKYSLLLGLAIILLHACGLSQPSVGSKIHLVERGMTMDEVRSILGNPSKQTFDEAYYHWYYFHPIYTTWLLVFQDNKVIRLETVTPKTTESTPAPPTVAHPQTLPPYPGDYRPLLPEAQFEHIYRSVDQAIGMDAEMRQLALHASRLTFTPSQGARLMKIFFTDRDKMEALRILAPSIEGSPLRYQLIDVFRFASDQQTASKILAELPSRYLRPALPEEFEAFYHYIQQKTFKDDKMLAIRTTAHSTLFSTDQAIRLLGIFTFDDDRLAVLRLIAPTVLNSPDKYRILEMLSFLSSQREARQLLNLS